jgi:hypothetical protein
MMNEDGRANMAYLSVPVLAVIAPERRERITHNL